MHVGLTGGIGAGKSVVSAILERLGAVVIDADVVAREVVASGTPGLAQIAARWPSVVSADGVLDRAALGRIVFADPAERAALNAIVHPLVRERSAALVAAQPRDRVVIEAIPLLFENDLDTLFDATILVVAPHDARLARVNARDGLASGEVARRIAAQIDPARARERATYIIENDGDLATLDARTRAVWDGLTGRASGTGSSADSDS